MIPGSGAFLTHWIRDPGWVKNQEHPGSYSESLEKYFLDKILKLFDVDAGPDPDPGTFLTLDPG
jgi:hypothetical protein